MNIELIYLYRVINGVCLFILTFRYSVVQFVMQFVKVMNIELIHLGSILFGLCPFTVSVQYSVCQCGIQIVKVMNIGLNNFIALFMRFVYSLLQFDIQQDSS